MAAGGPPGPRSRMAPPQWPGIAEHNGQCSGYCRARDRRFAAARRRSGLGSKAPPAVDIAPGGDRVGGPDAGARPAAGAGVDRSGALALRPDRYPAPSAARPGAACLVDPAGAAGPRRSARLVDGRHQPLGLGPGSRCAHSPGPALVGAVCGWGAGRGPGGRDPAVVSSRRHRRSGSAAAFRQLAAGPAPEPAQWGHSAHRGRWPAWPQSGAGGGGRILVAQAFWSRQCPLPQGVAANRAASSPVCGLARHPRGAGGGAMAALGAGRSGACCRCHHPAAGVSERYIAQCRDQRPAPLPGGTARLRRTLQEARTAPASRGAPAG